MPTQKSIANRDGKTLTLTRPKTVNKPNRSGCFSQTPITSVNTPRTRQAIIFACIGSFLARLPRKPTCRLLRQLPLLEAVQTCSQTGSLWTCVCVCVYGWRGHGRDTSGAQIRPYILWRLPGNDITHSLSEQKRVVCQLFIATATLDLHLLASYCTMIRTAAFQPAVYSLHKRGATFYTIKRCPIA